MEPRNESGAWPRWVEALRGHRVAVVGDPVLDVYLYGTTHRISREAPVLIVREEAREVRLGGAANTAWNFAALGAEISLIGLIGRDGEGAELTTLAARSGIDTSRLLARQRGCTVTKTRVLAGGLHTRKQQMLRLDRENEGAAEPGDAARVADAARAAFPQLEALVISDYGDASLTSTWVELAKDARAAGKIVVVDSRHAVTAFAGVTAVTPNEPEVEEALGLTLRSPEAALTAAARLTRELDLEATLLTRGREGMAVASRSGDPQLLAAHGGHEAVDVTGAGDTVTATFTLALTAGLPVYEAAVMANCAAAQVVKTVGTATCSPAELLAALSEVGR